MWVEQTWVFVHPSGGTPAMAYNIKHPKTDELIRELAREKGKPILDFYERPARTNCSASGGSRRFGIACSPSFCASPPRQWPGKRR